MGRLVLNVLLSFAQFEREIIAERTRDKVAATRRKGKWSGGTPLLGYDLDPRGGRLHVNEEEAQRVRAIFALYLEHESLLPVVQELERRGWVGKSWQTRKGRTRQGRPFTKTSLHRLLTNVVYAGKVRYKDEIHDGEQPALVDADTFGRVQALMRCHGPTLGPPSSASLRGIAQGSVALRSLRLRHDAGAHHAQGQPALPLLHLLRCRRNAVGKRVRPSRSPPRRWNNWSSSRSSGWAAIRRCWPTCWRKSAKRTMPASRSWKPNAAPWNTTCCVGRAKRAGCLAEVGTGESNGRAVTRLAELQDRLGQLEQRLARLRSQREALQQERLDEAAATRSLAGLETSWDELTPDEQGRIVHLLVARVDYDGAQGKMAITFHPLGLKTLAGERLGTNNEEQRA